MSLLVALLMWDGLFLVFVCLNVKILLLHEHAGEQPQMVIVAVRACKLMRGSLVVQVCRLRAVFSVSWRDSGI